MPTINLANALFNRAARAGDINAMRRAIAYGADPRNPGAKEALRSSGATRQVANARGVKN